MTFRYSFMQLVYHGEPIEASVDRLARFGYDAIELIGDRTAYDVPALLRACTDSGLVVSSVGSLPITVERDLVHPEAGYRKRALEYFKETLDFAAEVGAEVVIVGPSGLMKTQPLASADAEWSWAVDGIRAVGEHAASVSLDIAIEAWNRYESYWVTTLARAAELWRASGLSNGGVMGDLFHMNIEEASLPGALREAGSLLRHVHIADSNRSAPGQGHTDFAPVVEALIEIGYRGYLAMEILPASANPLDVIKAGAGGDFFDRFTQQSIEHLRALEPEA